MRPAAFVSALRALELENTFNPYAHRCTVHDRPDAPRVRARVLREVLEAACEVEVDAFWIGRDLGYRGGRRTGLALTDDVHLSAHAARWNIGVERPTRGEAQAERTAAVIWSVLERIEAPVFLWNVFPLHPHEPDDPFTNRQHNRSERAIGEELLAHLIMMLRPRRLVAIGRDAEGVLVRVRGGCDVLKVRHPSYGGQTDFLRQMRDLFDLREEQGLLL